MNGRTKGKKKNREGEIDIEHTLKHASVGGIGNGKDVWGHLMTL